MAAFWCAQAILEESHHRTVRSCEWSPDGKFLATASFDATTAIWEQTGGEFECVASLEVGFSPTSRNLDNHMKNNDEKT